MLLIGLGVAILIAAGVLVFKEKPEPVATDTSVPSQTENATSSSQETVPTGTDIGGEGMDIGGEVTIAVQTPTIITFTDAGYSPSSVTIKKGQTVRYVNNSNTGTWPASANHPSHTVYPQKSATDCLGSSFDACHNLKPGESWEFTFTEVGTWGYHDHSNAKFRGTVVVVQ